jgi:hypothetical protein
MAIELHHLNTHGMMEQACDVLDGVVRLKERIAELEKENAELRSKNEGLLYALADAETDLAMLQRWRKFSEEKPDEKMESGCAAGPAFLHDSAVRRAGENRQSDGFLPEYPQISFL